MEVKEIYNKEKNTWTMHYSKEIVEISNQEYLSILKARENNKPRIEQAKKERKQNRMRRMFENVQ